MVRFLKPIAEFEIPLGALRNKSKAEIEIHPVKAETKTSKVSFFSNFQTFLSF